MRKILLLSLILSFVCSAYAMPPYVQEQQHDTSAPLRTEISEPLIIEKPVGVDEASDFNLKELIDRRKYQELGQLSSANDEFNLLCVLVQFTDKQAKTSGSKIDSLVYSDADFIGSSVRHYYKTISYNKLLINSPYRDTVWITAPQPYSFYVDAASGGNYGFGTYPHNTQKLFEDCIAILDSIVDLSLYDNDRDGRVESICIIHSGSGAEYTGSRLDIWSHAWGVTPRMIDGVIISTYFVVPEYWSKPGDMTIGVICHELMHNLGIPDLYDTDGSSAGLGRHSIMANGSWNGVLGNHPATPTAYTKYYTGFGTPVWITNDTTITITSDHLSDTIYLIPIRPNDQKHVFALINRGYNGYATKMPTTGLYVEIWDLQKTGNTKEWYPDLMDKGNYRVAIMQPDNLYELEKRYNYGNYGDAYHSANIWSKSSTPSTDWYDTLETNISVEVIERLPGDDGVPNGAYVVEIKLCDCGNRLDTNGDGELTMDDIWQVVNEIFYNYPKYSNPRCPYPSSDLNCDGARDNMDLNVLISAMYYNDSTKVCYPCK